MYKDTLNSRSAWEREAIRNALTTHVTRLGLDTTTTALSVDGVLQIIDEIDHKNQRSLVKSIVDILGYTMEEIRSSDKHNAIAFARHFLSRYLHDNGWTLSAIGRSINRHHTTIINSLRTMDSMLSYDRRTKEEYDEFVRKVNRRRLCILEENERTALLNL